MAQLLDTTYNFKYTNFMPDGVNNIFLYDNTLDSSIINNASGPLLGLKNYGYTANDITSYTLPNTDSDKSRHRFINAEDIDWLGAEITVEAINRTFVINTLEDLIEFVNASYINAGFDISKYITKTTLANAINAVNLYYDDLFEKYKKLINSYKPKSI